MNIQYFRIDWFNILAVKGALKSLLQHHNSKASILRCSAFFIVQLSHPYMTTGLLLFTFMLGEENGHPLQCSCLENPRDGEAWWAAIYGAAQSWT